MSTSRPPAGTAEAASGAQDTARTASREPIDLARINWRRLSAEGRRALREVALPVSMGRSYAEITAATGMSAHQLARRMKALREELLAGMRDPEEEEVSQEEAFEILLDAAEGDLTRVAEALGADVQWVKGRLRELGLEGGGLIG